MKKVACVCVALVAGVLWSAETAQSASAAKPVQSAKSNNPGKMTLAEACERITEVIQKPEIMGDITSQLSAEDQNAFMIEINKAIKTMPGSNESKTAKFLVVEREALLAAKKGNLQPMVATMFATVTLESLTVLADRYAEDLFNREADASKKFTDEQFTEIASSTVKEVAKRCEGLVDSAPRDVLAVYLFEKSSNGTIPDLEDRLLEIAISDPQIRAVAKNEWLAEAKSKDGPKFDSLLAAADAGRAPNVDVTLQLAGPQVLSALVSDLAMGVMDSNGQQIMPITQGENPSERGITTPGQAQAVADAAMSSATKPRTADPLSPWNPSYSRSQVEEAKKKLEPEPGPTPGPEPKPYQYQD